MCVYNYNVNVCEDGYDRVQMNENVIYKYVLAQSNLQPTQIDL